MNLSLYKIKDIYLEACQRLLNQDSDIPQEAIADTLEGLAGEFKEKALNVAAYCKNLQKEIATIAEYEREMRQRRNRLECHVRNLRDYLKSNMEECNLSKIQGLEFNILIKNSPSHVVIESDDALPNEYKKLLITPDKAKLKQAIKEGIEIPGVRLETTRSLTIS